MHRPPGTSLAASGSVWLLLLMILIMPFENNPYLFISRNFAGVISHFTVIKLLGILGFGWAMLEIAKGRNEPIFASLQARLLGLFFFGILLSAALNGSALVAVTKYLAYILFLPFVLVAVRTEDDLRRVLSAMALALTLVFPYALRQVGRYGGRFGVGLYEPNYLAANLVLVIPIAVAIALTQPTTLKRMLWLGSALVLFVSLILTSSRGGLAGLLVAGTSLAYRRLGLKGALGALALVFLAVLPTDLGERAIATVYREGPAPPGLEASTRAHTALFWGGIRMMTDAPFVGVGPQRFKDYSQRYSGLDVPYVAHNSYLELGAEAGLGVLLLYLLLLVTTIGSLSRIAKLARGGPRRELGVWAEGLRAGLIGFAVSGAFISAQYEKFFWLAIFAAIVLVRLASTAAAQDPSPSRSATSPAASAWPRGVQWPSIG